MLTEIRSQKFRTGVVSFHSGLNVILGDANATNSIGKSTMLMVVDFAFGGKDLLEHNNDVVKELGHHDYFFTFQFDQEFHRFCRDTSQPDTVYRCGADFELGPPMTLEVYNAFLRQAYEVDLPDLSFRTLVGLYTRVWGKENLDTSKPLHVVPNKSGEDCVDNLIKIFDRYAAIRDISDRLDRQEKEMTAWRAAKNHRVIPSIKKKGYDDNQKSIATLESELSDIRVKLALYTANVSEVVNRELLELKKEKDRLLALRLTLASRLQRVQNNLRGNRAVRSENFQELVRFFPAIDQDRLARVGGFHTGVARLLRSELDASQTELEEQLTLIDQELASLDERMARSLNTVEAPTALVDRVADVATRMRSAREENGRYEHEVELRAEVKRLKDLLQNEKETILVVIDKFIIADDVTLEDLTPALAMIALEGPQSPDVLTAARAPALGVGYGTNVEWGSALVARLSVTGSPGVFIIVPVAEKDEILSHIEAAGVVHADEDAFRIVPLEHGKLRYGEDISERYLAQEANQADALEKEARGVNGEVKLHSA